MLDADRRRNIYLLCIFMWALAISVFFHSGFYASDDISYINSSLTLAHEFRLIPAFGADRLAINAINAVIFLITDNSIFWAAFFYNIFHPLTAIVVFLISNELFNRRVAMLSAILYTIMPLSFTMSGSMLPDVPMSFFILLSVFLLMNSLKSKNTTSRRGLLLLASAFSMYVASTFKEYAVVVCPAIALFIMVSRGELTFRERIKFVVLYAVGIISFLFIDALMFRISSGVWWFRLFQSSSGHVSDVLFMLRERYGTDPLVRTLNFHTTFHREHGVLSYVIYGLTLSVPIAAVYFLRRDRKEMLALCGFWFIGFWSFVYLLYGSASLTDYLPAAIAHRYFILPLALLSPVMLWPLYVTMRSAISERMTVMLIAAMLATSGIYLISRNHEHAGRAYGAENAHAFSAAYAWSKETTASLPTLPGEDYARRMYPLFEEPLRTWMSGQYGATSSIGRLLEAGIPFTYILQDERLYTEGDKRNIAAILEAGYRLELLQTPEFRPRARIREIAAMFDNGYKIAEDRRIGRSGLSPRVWLACPSAECLDKYTLGEWGGSRAAAAPMIGQQIFISEGGKASATNVYWLEEGHWRNMPQHPDALLAVPRTDVSGRYVVESTTELELVLRMFGYDESGKMVAFSRLEKSVDGERPIQVDLSISSKSPIRAIRAYAEMNPTGVDPGVVQMDFNIREADE